MYIIDMIVHFLSRIREFMRSLQRVHHFDTVPRGVTGVHRRDQEFAPGADVFGGQVESP
jgi:hypothetical protein